MHGYWQAWVVCKSLQSSSCMLTRKLLVAPLPPTIQFAPQLMVVTSPDVSRSTWSDGCSIHATHSSQPAAVP